MTRFLLPFLIDQANLGLKMGRAFKRDAFIAAEAVTKKFKLQCNDGNVLNYLKTIKTRYQLIRKLQSLSNTTWDENEKKIMMDEKEYAKYIVANPREETFLNKRIEMYDEIIFICGDDQTFDSIANGYAKEDPSGGFVTHEVNGDDHEIAVGDDVNILMDDEDLEIEEEGEATPATPRPPSPKSPQLPSFRSLQPPSSKSPRSQHPLAHQEEPDKVVQKAFDYLHEHESLVRGFLVKNHNLRASMVIQLLFCGWSNALNAFLSFFSSL